MANELDTFIGSLAGLAVGDTLGAGFEGMSRSEIGRIQEKDPNFLENRCKGRYTDDTHNALSIAEALISHKGFSKEATADRLVKNYRLDPNRGFGNGSERMYKEAADGAELIAHEKGSFTNAPAIRVAPVGLFYFDDYESLRKYAIAQAEITHQGPEAISGAVAIAYAVALAIRQSRQEGYDRQKFIGDVADFVQDICPQMAVNIKTMARFIEDDSLFEPLKAIGGRSIQHGPSLLAVESVPMAILFSTQGIGYFGIVKRAVLAGGDTDSTSAMTGAISGARYGLDCIPARLLIKLEAGERGKEYIVKLATDLYRAKSAAETACIQR